VTAQISKPANERLGFGPQMVDWETRVDFGKLRFERLARAQDAMRAAGADYLLLSRVENARYTTAIKRLYWPTIRLGGGPVVLLPQEGHPLIWITDPEYAAETLPWVPRENFRDAHEMELAGDVETTVRQLVEAFPGTAHGSIGVDIWSPAMREVLPRALPNAKLVDGQAVMQQAREVKTAQEIELMKMAYVMSEAGMQAALDILKPGVRESELVGTAMRRFWDFASETTQCSQNVNSGPGTFPYRRFHTDRIIQWGDIVNMDFGACFNGYFGDFCRTFVCGGKPNPAQADLLQRSHEMQMRTLAAIRPGVTPADLARETGHPSMGHGIGISAFEAPHLRPIDTYEIKPGMTFSVVTPMTMGSPELGGTHLEDEIYITDTGCVVYSTFPYFGIDF
jgi:Xaa-Pro aminopeptidase